MQCTANIHPVCKLQPRACVDGIWEFEPQLGELALQGDSRLLHPRLLLSSRSNDGNPQDLLGIFYLRIVVSRWQKVTVY